MDKMRNFLQSWQGRVAMFVVLAPMAFLGVQGNFGSSVSPNELIKTNKVSIDLSEYQSELNARRSELLALPEVDASMINESVLADEVLNRLVNRALLEHQTHFLGMTVSDDAISRLLQQEPSFQQDGQFSNELFANYLRHNGLTKDALFAIFRSDLSIRQLNASILGNAIYPKDQIGRLLNLSTEARELWVHRFKWQDYADQITVDDKEIDAYYQKHKDTLVRPDSVDLAYVELSADNVEIDNVSEEEIQAQYSVYLTQKGISDGRELSQILLTGDDAKAKADMVRAKLDKGESFEALAKAHSDDPSGSKGGAIGTYNPAVFGADAAAVTQALSGLGVGQSSQPVKTAFGYQIFKVTKASTAPSAESVRDELIQMAAKHKRESAFNELIGKINDMATDGQGIADIAKAAKLEAKHITAYPKTSNNTALSQPAVLAAAFDEFAIQDQSVSANITLKDKTVWVQPSNFQASKALSLAEAKEEIRAILVRQKAAKLAFEKANEIAKNAAHDGTNALMTTAANFGISTRQNPALHSAEQASLFLHKSGGNDVWAVQTEDGASVMIGGPVIEQSASQFSEQERQMATLMLRDNLGQDLLSDYMAYLKDTTKLTINESALSSQSH